MIRALLLACLAAPALAGDTSATDVLPALQGAGIVVLGEVHDNPAHHELQAGVVAALAPTALVFEMLTPEEAARATPQARQDATRLHAALGWEGWPEFGMYYPIFAAAPQARIYGAAPAREEVRRAVRAGAAEVFGPGAGAYGLTEPPADLEALAREQVDLHCGALPIATARGMVEAQRLRDAAFARATLAAYRESGGPVVLITGSGHARTDRAVPAMLARAAPGVKVVSVGQVEAGGAVPPFDVPIVTPPIDRQDPCADFAPAPRKAP